MCQTVSWSASFSVSPGPSHAVMRPLTLLRSGDTSVNTRVRVTNLSSSWECNVFCKHFFDLSLRWVGDKSVQARTKLIHYHDGSGVLRIICETTFVNILHINWRSLVAFKIRLQTWDANLNMFAFKEWKWLYLIWKDVGSVWMNRPCIDNTLDTLKASATKRNENTRSILSFNY